MCLIWLQKFKPQFLTNNIPMHYLIAY
jgi:hypothetical protein